jgi:hypothetical protein
MIKESNRKGNRGRESEDTQSESGQSDRVVGKRMSEKAL